MWCDRRKWQAIAAVWMIWAVISLTVGVSGEEEIKAKSPANLVQNGGFEEQGEGWTIPEEIMRIDTSVAHSGKASLRFSWDDPAKRRLALRPIPARPGKRYLIHAWIKSDNVHRALKGASFGVEWGSEKGYIGGSYPMGIGWTTDWTEVSFLSGIIPREATWAHVFVTIDWGGVGTAWIDDISVTEVETVDVFQWRVDPDKSVGDQDSKPFGVVIEKLVSDAFGEKVEVSVSLCSPPWNAPLTEQKASPQQSSLLFPTADLSEGVYKFSAAVKSRQTGRTLLEPEIKTAWKRPPMEYFIVPHSAVLIPGADPPALLVLPYRSGTVTGEVFCQDGVSVATIPSRRLRAGKDVRIGLSQKPVSPGRYEVRLIMISSGHPDFIVSIPFTVLTPGQAELGVVIGPDNLLRDRGKVWFPMFLYAHTAYDPARGELDKRDPKATADLLDHLTGTPFGLLDYATPIGGMKETVALADECARRGIRLILSVKDVHPGWQGLKIRAKDFPGQSPEQIVRSLAKRLRSHPALALYYTNDELSTQYLQAMKEMRRWLHEEDPLHPTLHVHYDLECIRELAPTYDIFGPELYPWPSDELGKMADWSETVTSSLPQGVPFWGCLWAFREEPQAAEKQRALAYIAIAKGARGLLFYSYHDLKALKSFEKRWQELVDLGREIESRLPVLLQPESRRPCKIKTPDVVLRTVSGKEGAWLLAVNAGKTTREADVAVSLNVRQAQEEDKIIPLSEGRLRFRMEPFQVRLMRLR